jgi:hypothetical protein
MKAELVERILQVVSCIIHVQIVQSPGVFLGVISGHAS